MANKSELASFRKPPLSEVYCGLVFKPLDRFQIHHIGLLWLRFQDEFPKIQYANRIGELPTEILKVGRLAVSRAWFVSDLDDQLVQVQDDRIIFNWRRRSDAGDYPRYPYVIEGFKKAYETLNIFVDEQELGTVEPTEYEMSYINVIPKGDGWDRGGNLDGILPDFCWQASADRTLPTPNVYSWQAVFAIPSDKGLLFAKLDQVTSIPKEEQALRLTLTVKGIDEDPSQEAMNDWFGEAHEVIVNAFADLTHKNVQDQIWERKK